MVLSRLDVDAVAWSHLLDRPSLALHETDALRHVDRLESGCHGMCGSTAKSGGRDPYDRGLSDLIGELSTRSEEFAELWAAHNVRLHRNVEKRFTHPLVGELALHYDRISVGGETDLEIFVYVAEPGSRSSEALDLLANWTADAGDTPRPAQAASEPLAVVPLHT